jgi:predicted DNA-binding transcriptional regulator AlpA
MPSATADIADLLKRVAALEQKVLGVTPDRRLTKRQVAEREGVSPRTIDRHVAAGFPAPEMICGRAYWWLSTLEAYDAERLQQAKRITANAARDRMAVARAARDRHAEANKTRNGAEQQDEARE